MLRVWSEYLPYADARTPEVLDLLASGPLHPLFAVPPDADLDALAGALSDVRARGLEPGIWPLLQDADGYWPSERNAPTYFEHVTGLLDELDALGVAPDWLAVDLEPPLQQLDELRHAVGPWHITLRRLAIENLDAERFTASVSQFHQGLDAMRHRGVRTLSVTLPLAAHDLRDGVPFWQDLFEAPWSDVPWTRAGIMAYGSMVAGYSKGFLSERDARAMHYRLFKHLARAFGPRAHASLGVTGTGKLGDEPVYPSPEGLAKDASAARAAGIDDLAIFCLEGLVGRTDAGQWVDAVAQAPAKAPPMTPRARVARAAGYTMRAALRTMWSR